MKLYDLSIVITLSIIIMIQAQIGNVPVENTSTIEIHNPTILTQQELNWVYRMVEAEATGGTEQSKINVTNVIVNRVLDNNFPDTIEGVLFQRNAFSPLIDKRFYKVEVVMDTVLAVDKALANPDTTDGALFFMCRVASESHNVTWFDSNLTFLFKDDIGHEFFK